jgi:hypothetical protein
MPPKLTSPFSMISCTRRHRFSLDIGRVSMMSTRSPIWHRCSHHEPSAYGALYDLFIKGCFTLSSMATTMVLSILSLTTLPMRVFLNFFQSLTVESSLPLLLSRGSALVFARSSPALRSPSSASRSDRLDAAISFFTADMRIGIIELVDGKLEAQVEKLLLEVLQLLVQVFFRTICRISFAFMTAHHPFLRPF